MGSSRRTTATGRARLSLGRPSVTAQRGLGAGEPSDHLRTATKNTGRRCSRRPLGRWRAHLSSWAISQTLPAGSANAAVRRPQGLSMGPLSSRSRSGCRQARRFGLDDGERFLRGRDVCRCGPVSLCATIVSGRTTARTQHGIARCAWHDACLSRRRKTLCLFTAPRKPCALISPHQGVALIASPICPDARSAGSRSSPGMTHAASRRAKRFRSRGDTWG